MTSPVSAKKPRARIYGPPRGVLVQRHQLVRCHGAANAAMARFAGAAQGRNVRIVNIYAAGHTITIAIHRASIRQGKAQTGLSWLISVNDGPGGRSHRLHRVDGISAALQGNGMDRDFILRRSAPVPRYTSYPTAPHFHAGVGEAAYAQWLGNVPQDARLSLYLHIPFCDRLCWFCGCHTKQTRRYDPVAAYIQALTAEIATVGRHLGGRGQVSAVHFGGGSPTLMSSKDMKRVNEALKSAFSFIDSPEISVEIDPNDMDDDRYDGLKAIGLTRASLGVQDFDPKVQAAINRLQSFKETKAVVERVRGAGCAFRQPRHALRPAAPDRRRSGGNRAPGAVAQAGPDRAVWLCACAMDEKTPDHDRRD